MPITALPENANELPWCDKLLFLKQVKVNDWFPIRTKKILDEPWVEGRAIRRQDFWEIENGEHVDKLRDDDEDTTLMSENLWQCGWYEFGAQTSIPSDDVPDFLHLDCVTYSLKAEERFTICISETSSEQTHYLLYPEVTYNAHALRIKQGITFKGETHLFLYVAVPFSNGTPVLENHFALIFNLLCNQVQYLPFLPSDMVGCIKEDDQLIVDWEAVENTVVHFLVEPTLIQFETKPEKTSPAQDHNSALDKEVNAPAKQAQEAMDDVPESGQRRGKKGNNKAPATPVNREHIQRIKKINKRFSPSPGKQAEQLKRKQQKKRNTYPSRIERSQARKSTVARKDLNNELSNVDKNDIAPNMGPKHSESIPNATYSTCLPTAAAGFAPNPVHNPDPSHPQQGSAGNLQCSWPQVTPFPSNSYPMTAHNLQHAARSMCCCQSSQQSQIPLTNLPLTNSLVMAGMNSQGTTQDQTMLNGMKLMLVAQLLAGMR